MTPRRRLLIALIAVVCVTAALLAVAWVDTTRPVVREYVVEVPGLSGELRILHVSDLHASRFGPGQERIGSALAGQRFDAAFITGDLLVAHGGDRQPAFELVDVLKKHTDAVLYVQGNHDDGLLTDQLATRGVIEVHRGNVIRLGAGDSRAAVVSADRHGAVTARLGVTTPLLVVAMHQPPDAATLAAVGKLTDGPQVFLAGHTHAGQIRVPGIGAIRSPLRWEFGPIFGGPADEWFPELRGLQVTGVRQNGHQVVEITPGLGTTKVPFRLFDTAEITVLRLVPKR